MATEYTKKFIKKDGSERKMRFVRLSELTYSDYDIYSIPPPTGSAPRKYAEGNELVWDLDCEDFRIFNWKSVID
jgi:hypothetical protein